MILPFYSRKKEKEFSCWQAIFDSEKVLVLKDI
jgi:hypothetical protein